MSELARGSILNLEIVFAARALFIYTHNGATLQLYKLSKHHNVRRKLKNWMKRWRKVKTLNPVLLQQGAVVGEHRFQIWPPHSQAHKVGGKRCDKKNKTKQQQGHNKNLTLRDNTGCVKPTVAACAMSIKMWADIRSEKLQGISSASEGKEYEQEMCEKGDNVHVHKKRQKKLAATQKEGGNTVK